MFNYKIQLCALHTFAHKVIEQPTNMTYLITERIAIKFKSRIEIPSCTTLHLRIWHRYIASVNFHEYTKQMLDSKLGIQVLPSKPIKHCQARAR